MLGGGEAGQLGREGIWDAREGFIPENQSCAAVRGEPGGEGPQLEEGWRSYREGACGWGAAWESQGKASGKKEAVREPPEQDGVPTWSWTRRSVLEEVEVSDGTWGVLGGLGDQMPGSGGPG